MTVRECYNLLEGDYDDVLERLLNERRIQKFMVKFLNDNSFNILKGEIMADCNYGRAFRAVHTLKDVSQTLGFTQLYNSTVPLVEKLRSTSHKDILPLFETVQDNYNKTVSILKQFCLENGI